jgi:GNAT superfamily N-acetyltransferase
VYQYYDWSIDYDDWSSKLTAMKTFSSASSSASVAPPSLGPTPRRWTSIVRPARPADLASLVALLDRCSEDTVYRRFHGASGRTARLELERIAHPTAAHQSWVAVVDGVIRGTATLAWGADGVPEAAFLVEDGWFRQGLGRKLFGALAQAARTSSAPEVVVAVQGDNERARRFLRAMAPGARTTFSGGGGLEMAVPVVRAAVPPPRRSLASRPERVTA